MTPSEATAAIADALATIAPEVELDLVDPDVPFRAELDLDSLDFLNLVQALHNATGIDIPEADYARVDTIARLASYLASHTPAAATG